MKYEQKATHPWACDLSRGDAQCPYVSPRSDSLMRCCWKAGHPRDLGHQTSYDGDNAQDPWALYPTPDAFFHWVSSLLAQRGSLHDPITARKWHGHVALMLNAHRSAHELIHDLRVRNAELQAQLERTQQERDDLLARLAGDPRSSEELRRREDAMLSVRDACRAADRRAGTA